MNGVSNIKGRVLSAFHIAPFVVESTNIRKYVQHLCHFVKTICNINHQHDLVFV